MSVAGKDSDEVVKFMALFGRLKDWTDDRPDTLVELAAGDPGVADLCDRLFSVALSLTMNERRRRALFAAPVDPAFVSAWRDYEDRYGRVVSDIWFPQLLLSLSETDETSSPTAISKTDLQWDNADEDAEEQAQGIDQAIEFARFNIDQEGRWSDDQADFIEQISDGTAAWGRLKDETGFDLRGVFRRRALVPFVLVPRGVAAKQGSGDTISLLTNLQHAHDAFVFGATYAALALMRSILEAVLRDHYQVEGRDLAERIRNARARLPAGASEAALHRLRRRANAILHLDQEKGDALPKMDDAGLEKEIVSLLFVLRALIEGAK